VNSHKLFFTNTKKYPNHLGHNAHDDYLGNPIVKISFEWALSVSFRQYLVTMLSWLFMPLHSWTKDPLRMKVRELGAMWKENDLDPTFPIP